jgi:hypothetical protein
MSANAVHKAEGDGRDRRSRMVTSSVHQPVKKDGAGSHSWGTATDVTDFAPVGAGGAKVVIGAPVAAPVVVPGPSGYVGDASQFPGLGGATVVSGTSGKWSSAPSALREAPPAPAPASPIKVAAPVYHKSKAAPIVVQAGHWPAGAYHVAAAQTALAELGPTVVLDETTNRPGTAGIYDATHPRNQFARKPRTTAAAAPAEGREQGVEQAAIDWTSPGAHAASTQIIQAAANPAHLGLYQQASTGPSMSVLRAMPTIVKEIPSRTNPAQMATKYSPMAHVPKAQMPRMLQPRGR